MHNKQPLAYYCRSRLFDDELSFFFLGSFIWFRLVLNKREPLKFVDIFLQRVCIPFVFCFCFRFRFSFSLFIYVTLLFILSFNQLEMRWTEIWSEFCTVLSSVVDIVGGLSESLELLVFTALKYWRVYKMIKPYSSSLSMA